MIWDFNEAESIKELVEKGLEVLERQLEVQAALMLHGDELSGQASVRGVFKARDFDEFEQQKLLGLVRDCRGPGRLSEELTGEFFPDLHVVGIPLAQPMGEFLGAILVGFGQEGQLDLELLARFGGAYLDSLTQLLSALDDEPASLEDLLSRVTADDGDESPPSLHWTSEKTSLGVEIPRSVISRMLVDWL
ncbi:MAG: hypothetical protein AB7S38_15620 [Vulcanimicrobiota bacterium]